MLVKRRFVVIFFIACVLGIGGYYIDRSRSAKESLLSGYFESQPTLAASRLGGRVVEILVKEGDAVKPGQELVRLETKSFGATYGASKMAAELANQQYSETARGSRPEEILRQEAVVREAQASLDKLTNGPLPEEIAAARAKLEGAKSQYKKMLAGARPEEIASAKAARNVALEKYRQAQRGLTKEQIAQIEARYKAAIADEELAQKQSARQEMLFAQGAIAKKDYDAALAAAQEATERRIEAKAALKDATNGTPKEELAQAQQAYRQAQSQLDLVLKGNRKEDIEAARQEMVADEQNLKLLVRGTRQEDIQAGRARLQEAQAALLELKRGNRAEDIAKSKAAASQADLQAKSVAETLKEKVVYADRVGQIDRVLVAVGDLVPAGGPVVQVGYPDDIWLRVYIPESQLPKVKVGDSAELTLDGVPESIEAKVESIATTGEFTPANLQSPEERGKQVFGVRIRLAKADPRVKAGMYATVKRVGKWP